MVELFRCDKFKNNDSNKELKYREITVTRRDRVEILFRDRSEGPMTPRLVLWYPLKR